MKLNKLYTIKEAIEFAKNNSKCSFDSTIEVHFNLNVDIKKGQTVRFSTTLPHGTGQEVKVAVFASKKVPNADLELSESDISKIESGKLKPKEDFDVLIAEPKFMAKIAKVAPILGPAGVMPNPKAGTITTNVSDTVKLFKAGQMEIRTEPNAPLIHTILGKKSFETKKLQENFEEIFTTLKQNRPHGAKPTWIQKCFIKDTMSPAAEVDLETLR